MKLGLALLATVLITVILTILNLRAFVAVEREQLVARAAQALGRPLHVDSVGPSWWPLGIRMRGLRVDETAEFGGGALLEVPVAVIPIRLASLVGGKIEPAGFRLEAPRLRLIRDAQGRWNVESLDRARDTDTSGAGPNRARRAALRIPVEWVAGVALAGIDGGRIEIEDRAQATPRRLTVEQLRLTARDVRFGATATAVIDAVVRGTDDVARLRADIRVPRLGEHDVEDTPFEATMELRELELGPIGMLAGIEPSFTGRVDEVRADVRGTSLRFDATISAHAEATSARSGSRPLLPAAALALDARFACARDRIDFQDARLSLGTLTVAMAGALTRTPPGGFLKAHAVDGSSFALALGEPPLVARELHVEVLVTESGTKLAGGVRLDEMPVELSGAIERWSPPTGDVRLLADVFGGSVQGTVAVSDTGTLQARVEAQDVDLGDGMARLAPAVGADVDGRVSGSASMHALLVHGDVDAASAIGGGEVTIVDGLIRGANIAERVLGDVAGVSALPRALSAETRARYARLVGSEDTVVHRASVPFTIGDRRIVAERATLTSDDFEVSGNGWLRLDGELRFHGDLVLSRPVSDRLAEEVRAVRLLRGADGRIAVPFRMRGPIRRAHPEADSKRLRARGLSGLVAQGKAREAVDPAVPSRGRSGARDGDAAVRDFIERLEDLIRP